MADKGGIGNPAQCDLAERASRPRAGDQRKHGLSAVSLHRIKY
jgi:hypothetical protein